MRKVRLLLVTDEMEVGGTQRQITYLAKYIDRNCYEPTVLYFRNRSFLVDELEDSGVPVLCVPKSQTIDPVFLWKLRSVLAKGRFDLIHCFSFTGELWGAVAHRMVQGSILITSVRNVYDWYSPTQWLLKRWITRQSQRVIANSRAGARYAEDRMRLPRGMIDVVYNGTALQHEISAIARSTARVGLGITQDKVIGLFAGRLVPQKDVPSLLRAIDRLKAHSQSLVLLIAGDGPLRQELERFALTLRLSGQVRFLGGQNNIHNLMQAADFLVLPSIREGLSNAILEGMVAGVPVVASNAGGNPELVADRLTGLLYPAGDDAALAECLKIMVENADIRWAYGEAGRQRVVMEFSLSGMVKAMEAIYAGCLRVKGVV